MRAKSQKLNYIWHNPNTPEEMQDFLTEWYADAIFKIVNGNRLLEEIKNEIPQTIIYNEHKIA